MHIHNCFCNHGLKKDLDSNPKSERLHQIKTWQQCQKHGCNKPVEILPDHLYSGLPGWAKYYCSASHAFQDQ